MLTPCTITLNTLPSFHSSHFFLTHSLIFNMGDKNIINLPPGFRFNPTDQELITHFLYRKVSRAPVVPDIIPDLGLYPYDPWDLNGKALAGDNYQWYFFSRKTSNRVSTSGYWMAMDINQEEQIMIPHKKVTGLKKYFVFYTAQGLKTNWIMHEYRLSGSRCGTSTSSVDSTGSTSRSSHQRRALLNHKIESSKWVVCRVFEQSNGDCSEEGYYHGGDNDGDDGTELSGLDEVFLSLDDLDDISLPNHY